jgi:hypothetical protein
MIEELSKGGSFNVLNIWLRESILYIDIKLQLKEYSITSCMLQCVLEITSFNSRYARHLVNSLLNTIWSSCLEIVDTAQIV